MARFGSKVRRTANAPHNFGKQNLSPRWNSDALAALTWEEFLPDVRAKCLAKSKRLGNPHQCIKLLVAAMVLAASRACCSNSTIFLAI